MKDCSQSIYLDNAATSHPKPAVVAEAMVHFLTEVGGTPARGGHARALEASRIVHRTRAALARLFHVADSSRIALLPSATEALNLTITGTLGPGDRVITTDMEHNAVWRPLQRAVRVQQIELVVLRTADRSDDEIVVALRELLREPTRLVVAQHASNVTGRVLPIGAMGAEIREAGSSFLVDAAQTAGVLDIDVEQMAIDLLAFPGHKGLLGPQGTGGLYVAVGHEPVPLIVGGTGSHSELEEQPTVMPDRYESGTQNAVGIAGLGAALEWLAERGLERIREGKHARAAQLRDGLRQIAGLRVLELPAGAIGTGVVSVGFTDADPSVVADRLDREHGVATRAGLHCAPVAHRALDTFPDGTLRFSVGAFTSEQEVRTALQALAEILDEHAHETAARDGESGDTMTMYQRDPGIRWRREAHADERARQALGADDTETASGMGTVTLVVAGQMVQLNLVGGEIWELLDGTRAEQAVLDELEARFDAPRDRLAADLHSFVSELATEGWIRHA